MASPDGVLITGGSGFLGAHLIDRFQQAGARIRSFDLLGAGDRNVEHVAGDVRDLSLVARAVQGADVVIHAAFASPRQPRASIESVNVEGTESVCAAAQAAGVRRFILISSTIVLKPPRRRPIFPDSPLSRLDAYRASRVRAEAIVREFGGRGLSYAIARPKTLLGPGRLGAFAIVFEWIRLGKPVLVLGTGRNRYQLLDVRDLAEGISGLATSSAEGIFSFGARDFKTVREDLQSLLDHAGTGARLKFLPPSLARTGLGAMDLLHMVPLSEWHQQSARGVDSVVDVSRAEQEIAWRPFRSNAAALRDAYDWYVQALTTSGTVKTTHPTPVAHRALEGLLWILHR